MHCHPKIVDQLEECPIVQQRDITSEHIREAIWYHRSGVNFKTPLCLGLHTDGLDQHDASDDTFGDQSALEPSLDCRRPHPPSSFDQKAPRSQEVRSQRQRGAHSPCSCL